MIYRILFQVFILFCCSGTLADTSPYLEGSEEDLDKYFALQDVDVGEGKGYLSFTLSEGIFSEFLNEECLVNVSVKLLLAGEEGVGVRFSEIDSKVVGKQIIELDNLEMHLPIKVILKYGNVPGSCSANRGFEKLYGIYFDLNSVSDLVRGLRDTH